MVHEAFIANAVLAGTLPALVVAEAVPVILPNALQIKARLRGASIRHLADPALATAVLNASPKRLLSDLDWMGFLFESMVVRDLQAFAVALDGNVFHDRDNTGLEADAIITGKPPMAQVAIDIGLTVIARRGRLRAGR